MIGIQTAWKRSFGKGPYRVGLHLIFWLFYFTIFTGFNYYVLSMVGQSAGDIRNNILMGMLFNIIIICPVYYLTVGTAYKFLFDKNKYLNKISVKYVYAILCLLGCFIIFSQLLYLGNWGSLKLADVLGVKLNIKGRAFQESVQKWGYRGVFTSAIAWVQMVFSFFILMGVPVAARFLRDQVRLRNRENELERQNIKLEMEFIKAQIHPHFLFNTLNNIYSLITHHESEKSAEMVSGLSSLLRYSLYDGKTEFILLEKEVTMLKDFIELEAVRSDNTKLTVHLPSVIPPLKIPPFLLLPLVENAFKHGVNAQLEKSSVTIDLEINKEELLLQVKNSFDAEYRKKNSGGLGLANLKKRLNYYYEDHYLLNILEADNVFTASLKLPSLCPKSNA